MTTEQVESQLSAMFDGELPAAECELLSRRIDRDENLRARWSRYALIGAAMRSEPVATARHGFASRVNAALQASDGKVAAKSVRKRTLWNTALAASMVAAVAGVSITTLRYSTPYATTSIGGTTARTIPAMAITAPLAVSASKVDTATDTGALRPASIRVVRNGGTGEPVSYVTPTSSASSGMALRTQLADFIVAHSEYSTPLMRRNVLSELVSNEDSSEVPAPYASPAGAIQINAAPAASAASH